MLTGTGALAIPAAFDAATEAATGALAAGATGARTRLSWAVATGACTRLAFKATIVANYVKIEI